MKIALASRAVPHWDCRTLAVRAAAMGYKGVELTHPLTEPPDEIRAAVEAAGVAVACLATTVSMPPRTRDRARAGETLRGAIDSAARTGSGYVTIYDPPLRAGQTPGGTAAEMGEWLCPLADFAAERGVTVLVENALHFRRARDLWTLLEAVGHPSVAAAWDLVRSGEQPSISVPTLNLRIQYARVADLSVPAEDFVRRLKGVGYRGYVTVDYPAGVSEEVLADAAVRLKGWIAPQAIRKGSGGAAK
jgi:sugar phosphate isomerase/epimerase